jgi:hypothetical protein
LKQTKGDNEEKILTDTYKEINEKQVLKIKREKSVMAK